MGLKEKVLDILNSNVGCVVSGMELSWSLGVTRNSIWKAVNKLKSEGYDITSHSSHGYVLNQGVDLFSVGEINKHLDFKSDIIIYEEATSSNDIAKQLAQNGAAEGTVVVVKSQTNGKGRLGRSFISKSEGGLYFTVVLRPKIPADKALDITVLSAVATAMAINKTSGQDAKIKWVNDIYINDKKCAGILTEAQLNFEMGTLDYAVIGIGINIVPPDNGFDAEISKIATSVFENNAPRGYKSYLLAEILNNIFRLYEGIEKREYIDSYREKSCIIGKTVDVYIGNEIISGEAVDIDENARLVVKTSDGIRSFSSGEARVREKGVSL